MRAAPGVRRKNSRKGTVCAVCGAPGPFEPAYRGIKAEGLTYEVYFCKACGLGRTEPALDDAELKRLYSSALYREADSTRFKGPVEKLVALFRSRRCRRVERYSRQKGRLLDIGCGRGDFVALMSKRGWEVTGIELDERVKERGRKMGLDLRSGSLEDARFPDGHFDAVTLWHVFEHIRDPLRTLKECRRVLKPGGLLLIAVPNAASLQARLSGRDWFHLDPPFHLYHYSPRNLLALLDRTGFRAGKIKHLSLEYNPYGYVQSIFNRLGVRRNLLYDFLRSRHDRDGYTVFCLALMFFMMPVVLPAALLLSLLEAALGRGGTIEVYSIKQG